MNRDIFKSLLATAALAVLVPLTAQAQSSISEDFTTDTTSQAWWFFNGDCLTASNKVGVQPSVTVNNGVVSAVTANGTVPGCTTIQSSYYNKSAGEVLTGGASNPASFPDAQNSGALRFTNGYPYGKSENGGIVFANPFPTGQGVSITFKTVTYLGDSGGGGGDGADGISFYLMDASKLDTTTVTGTASGDGNGLGAWGGSLGYSCSNSNRPYNGLNGGYVGLGIDEYGNFLNGTNNTLNETDGGSTNYPGHLNGDNTATGGQYRPNRIGMRGAGAISWLSLNAAYGTNPSDTTKPYYPSSLSSSCLINGGTYNSSTGACMNCSQGGYNVTTNTCPATTQCTSGTYYSQTGKCESCSSGTYNPTTNSCPTTTCSSGTYNAGNQLCESCSTGTYDATLVMCEVCPAGYTYQPATQNCKKGATIKPVTSSNTPTTSAPKNGTLTTTNTVANNLSSADVDNLAAVRNTCKTGNLWNYATPTAPTSAGAATLSNPVNTAGILDYAALPGGYVVLPSGTQIANETALTRAQATPIFYQLKISQNGLLSLSYATCPPGSNNGCSAFTQVINKQDITAANGPLPANFLFAFAGSTGGATNIHEILCFKADPATSAGSSAGASEKQSAKLETGVQAYFAYYNPSNGWTGRVTASSLSFDQYGNIVVSSTPNWDASCVLTGVPSGSTCSTTGGPPVAPEGAANRVMFTYDGSGGVPFTYANLSAAQQTAINAGDTTPYVAPYTAADRTNYLRGDIANEINTAGAGLFRRRTSILGDVMDSSPIWVGPPNAPYTAVWSNKLNSSDSLPENSTTSSYTSYVSNNTNRTQMVYVGANDGFLHGFRSGVFNAASGTCASTPTSSCFVYNDGKELLAYMPAAIVNTIHSTTANVDFPNAQYGHNYFVDATPGSGDLYYGNAWHTWLVGGLGPGGNAIYALDVTDPGQTTLSSAGVGTFVQNAGNASTIVRGEWSNTTITCSGNTSCGSSLGNTYGTPQIRRLHDGNWGIIFGNGLNSANGDAGIFVGVLDQSTGNPTFYYLQAPGTQGTSDGVAFVTPVDLDGDHMTDYVYAGDITGHIWRFDLTGSTESLWTASTPAQVFKSNNGQPITTALVVASGAPSPGMTPQIMVLFGTGQRVPVTNTSGATFASGTQSLYGVWDWNMSAWNSLSAAQYAAMASGAPAVVQQSNLQGQTVTISTFTVNGVTTQNRDIANNATVCWAGRVASCPSGNVASAYGWYLNLPGAGEQIIYSPELVQQALTVNSIVPAVNTPTSCSNNTDTGFTYVISALTGGAFNQVFLPPSQRINPGVNTNQAYLDNVAIAMQTNATGSSFITTNSAGTAYLVYETNQVESGNGGGNIQGGTLGLNLPPNTTGRRLSWIERR